MAGLGLDLSFGFGFGDDFRRWPSAMVLDGRRTLNVVYSQIAQALIEYIYTGCRWLSCYQTTEEVALISKSL